MWEEKKELGSEHLQVLLTSLLHTHTHWAWQGHRKGMPMYMMASLAIRTAFDVAKPLVIATVLR